MPGLFSHHSTFFYYQTLHSKSEEIINEEYCASEKQKSILGPAGP